MARPSRNTHLQLIQAARLMLPETGASGLNLREVAKRAGVNLGMFHYHFKTKSLFVRAVVESVYEDFLKDFQGVTAPSHEPDPLKRLEMALITVGQFARKNRKLFLILLKDLMDGDKEVILFIRNIIRPHSEILITLLKECQEKKLLAKVPVGILLMQGMMMMNIPIFGLGMFEKLGVKSAFGMNHEVLERFFASDEALFFRAQSAVQFLARIKEFPQEGAR